MACSIQWDLFQVVRWPMDGMVFNNFRMHEKQNFLNIRFFTYLNVANQPEKEALVSLCTNLLEPFIAVTGELIGMAIEKCTGCNRFFEINCNRF